MFVSSAHALGLGDMFSGAGGMAQFLPLIMIFGVFYFLLIRPQQQKQKETRAMIAAVKRGDRVVTGGGILGTVRQGLMRATGTVARALVVQSVSCPCTRADRGRSSDRSRSRGTHGNRESCRLARDGRIVFPCHRTAGAQILPLHRHCGSADGDRRAGDRSVF